MQNYKYRAKKANNFINFVCSTHYAGLYYEIHKIYIITYNLDICFSDMDKA